MAHVFISYAHVDYDQFVATFIERLEKTGFDKWIDHEQLAGGKDWTEDIDNGIEESYGLIVIKSEASSLSQYVTYEWSYALGQGIPIIPILYQVQSKPHLRLEAIQHFNFTDTSWPEWDAFIERLREAKDEFGTVVRIPPDAPREVKECLKELNSRIPQRRADGAQELGRLGNPIAVKGLSTMLNDDSWAVRMAAAKALGEIKDKEAVEPLMACLVQYYEKEKQFSIEGLQETFDNAIAKALIHIGFEATSVLVESLNHEIPNIRMAAALILGRIKDKRATHALIEASYNNKDEAQRLIIWAMGQIADETCVPVIINTLKSNAIYAVRFECIQALGYMGDKRAYEPLIEILMDNWGEPSTIINHPSGSVSTQSSSFAQLRSAAAQALGVLGDKRAVLPLCRILLSEPDASTGSSAINSLMRLVDNSHLDMLMDVMKQSRTYPLTQYSPDLLLDIIRSIGTPEALDAVEAWKQENKAT